ncbi:MAG TPA: NAD(P)H-dependent oxidoreductase, partial [Polyangiaceae bacterium]
MPKLSVIIGSTRPGRVGLPVGQWFTEVAKSHGKFEVTLVDLKERNLPLLDEPKHPRLAEYVHEHTKAWSEIVKASDA